MPYEVGERRRVAGRLKKILATNGRWSVCLFEVPAEDGSGWSYEEKFTGTLDDGCRTGAGVAMEAEWTEHPKYGEQWKIVPNTLAYPAPMTDGEFRLFCLNDKDLHDLSQAAMQKLWDESGEYAVMDMITGMNRLLRKAKLGAKDVACVKSFSGARGPGMMIHEVLPHMPMAQVERVAALLVEKAGNVLAARARAEKQLEALVGWDKHGEGDDDPFGTLCGDWKCPFPVADAVFMEDLHGSDFSPCRIRRILYKAVEQELRSVSGANYIPVDEEPYYWKWFYTYFKNVPVYEKRPVPAVTPDGLDLTADADFMKFVEGCCASGRHGVTIDETTRGNMRVRRLYTDRMLYAEKLCAKAVADARAHPVNQVPPAGMDSWDGLDKSQKAAVRTALKSRLSFITGGPGSGKTRTLGALVEAWEMLHGGGSAGYHKIMVLAPTGKAANRAKGSTGCACAGTIDRLFAKNSGEFAKFGTGKQIRDVGTLEPEEHEIEAVSSGTFEVSSSSLVIVDEASMIDVEKAGRLFHLLYGCTIVFAGDVDQLPPIESGAFFKECLDSNRVAVAKLTENHRAKTNRALPAAAAKVRMGQELSKFDFSNFNPLVSVRSDQMDLALMIADDRVVLNGMSPAENLVVSEYRRLLASGADPRDIMVLTPYRGSAPGEGKNARMPYRLSSYNLNGLLQDVVNPVGMGANSYVNRGQDAEGTWVEGRGRATGVYDRQGREIRIGDRIVNLVNNQDLKWEQYDGHDFLSGAPVPQPYRDNVGVFNGEGGIVRRVYMETPGRSAKDKPCRVLVELDDQRSKADREDCPERPKWLVANTSEYWIQDGGRKVRAHKLEDWVLGYATTFHKAQGCEAAHVILALSEDGRTRSFGANTFLTRNLLYTGLTRSSGSCLVIGTLEFLNLCSATPCQSMFIALKDRIRRTVAANAAPSGQTA